MPVLALRYKEKCMRCLIIHNTASGFGSDAIYAFQRALLRAGDECTFRLLDKNFHTETILRDVEDFDVVVLSGGDGTIAALLYALRTRDVRICVFPSGTANLLFTNLGNAAEPAAIARACRGCRTVTCDLAEASWNDSAGNLHTRGFSIMGGSGFDAEIMRAALPDKKIMGEAAYFKAALVNHHPTFTHFTIDVDGKRFERDGMACLVANCAMIQGDINIIPDCFMNDGELNVIVLETKDITQLIRPVLAGIMDPVGKGIKRPHIESFQGKSIHITTSKPIPMQLDGDVVADEITEYHVEVIPRANKIIVDENAYYAPDDNTKEALFSDASEIAYPDMS